MCLKAPVTLSLKAPKPTLSLKAPVTLSLKAPHPPNNPTAETPHHKCRTKKFLQQN